MAEIKLDKDVVETTSTVQVDDSMQVYLQNIPEVVDPTDGTVLRAARTQWGCRRSYSTSVGNPLGHKMVEVVVPAEVGAQLDALTIAAVKAALT